MVMPQPLADCRRSGKRVSSASPPKDATMTIPFSPKTPALLALGAAVMIGVGAIWVEKPHPREGKLHRLFFNTLINVTIASAARLAMGGGR